LQASTKQAYKYYDQLKKDDLWQENWLTHVVKVQAVNTSTPQGWWGTNLEHQVNTSNSAPGKICLGKTASKLSIVMVTEQQGHMDTLKGFSSKTDLERACLVEAKQWFMQACDTPCLMEPLLSIFGETGATSGEFDEVLAGICHCQPLKQ